MHSDWHGRSVVGCADGSRSTPLLVLREGTVYTAAPMHTPYQVTSHFVRQEDASKQRATD